MKYSLYFHLVQNILKLILRFFFGLTCYLEACCLASKYLEIFPDILLLLISGWIPLLSEQILYDFYTFHLVKVCFVVPNVIYLGEYNTFFYYVKRIA